MLRASRARRKPRMQQGRGRRSGVTSVWRGRARRRSPARPLGAQVRPVDVATLAEERARAALQTELSLFEADRTVSAGPGERAGAGGARAGAHTGCVHPPAANPEQQTARSMVYSCVTLQIGRARQERCRVYVGIRGPHWRTPQTGDPAPRPVRRGWRTMRWRRRAAGSRSTRRLRTARMRPWATTSPAWPQMPPARCRRARPWRCARLRMCLFVHRRRGVPAQRNISPHVLLDHCIVR